LKSAKPFLEHILASVEVIEDYVDGKTFDDFSGDVKLQDAVMRRMEIVGEAAKNVPQEFKKEHPGMPWAEMAGMRDMLIHHYFGVSLRVVWDTAKENLPPLKEKVGKILRNWKD
jgi:uncharacterized protein with HEPN domain